MKKGGSNGNGARLNQLANILNAQNHLKRKAESALHNNGPKVSAPPNFMLPGLPQKVEDPEIKEDEQHHLEGSGSQDGGWGNHSDDQELSQSGSEYDVNPTGEGFQDSELEEKDTILKVSNSIARHS